MIVDVRTYVCKPGMLQAQLQLYEKYAYPTQLKYIGEPLAFVYGETGALNTYVHLWPYESAGDREKKRAAMAADPAWAVYGKELRAAGYLTAQHNSLMIPAKFAPPVKITL